MQYLTAEQLLKLAIEFEVDAKRCRDQGMRAMAFLQQKNADRHFEAACETEAENRTC